MFAIFDYLYSTFYPMNTESEKYISAMNAEFKNITRLLTKLAEENLPTGFELSMSYGMISFDVPLKTYAKGYNGNPKQALPFISIGAQKKHVALYHLGLYSSPELMNWFLAEWIKQFEKKPDIGKSCIRFKKIEDVPVKLMAELLSKLTPAQWVEKYEDVFAQRKK